MAVILSFIITAFLLFFMGYNPIKVYIAMFQGSFGSVNSIATTLSKAVPLIFAGLGIGLALKAGMFNIGGEGQIYIGSFVASVVAILLPPYLGIVSLIVSFIAGTMAAMIWAGSIGFIKSKFNINEVIICIMTNYIAILLTSYLLKTFFQSEGSSVSQSDILPVGLSTIVPRTQLTSALYLGLIFSVLIYILLKYTVFGYEVNAMGDNPNAAHASGGINITKMSVLVMGLSGAIVSLAGITDVFGKYGRFIDGFSPGYGFTGIAIAVIGKCNPFGIILSSILFAALDAGALRANRVESVSINIVMVIQGLVVIFVSTPYIISILRQNIIKVFSKRSAL